MENTIEIAQNQLTLFDMLTVDQEIELARRVKQATFEADTNERRLNEIIKLLSDKGFTGRHFKYEVNNSKIIQKFIQKKLNLNDSKIILRSTLKLLLVYYHCFLYFVSFESSAYLNHQLNMLDYL